MENSFNKRYIETSNEFRKSNGSKESVIKLYDFLYQLTETDRTKNDELILANVFSLLEFHQSAYETFKAVADLTNRKNTTKLYALEQKAKSHGNNFKIKDIRAYQKKNKQPKLFLTDFFASERDDCKFGIPSKQVVIFNKIIDGEKIEIHLPDTSIKTYINDITHYISWLNNCKDELIQFYNSWNKDYIEEKADSDWYDTLEIYSVRISVGNNGGIYAEISGGDEYNQDHILDIETGNKTIVSMNYDG